MSDTSFMQDKYSVDTLVDHYLADIKSLRSPGMPADAENQLKRYYQAARVYKGLGITDIAQFALSMGRSKAGKIPLMRKAFPTLLGNDVGNPIPIDLEYAQLLLAYALAFQAYRKNLKAWMLRFVLSSRFSPVAVLVEQQIQWVIQDTQQKIQMYNNRFHGQF